jgi:predicted membrane-bound spermidine synthase
MKKPALSRRMLFGIFTVSGFSGLIYESIWSHYLKLFLGHAAYAQTLVLAIFMGGMALGAWLVARNTGRIKNLLVAYALVELLTGVIALVFHKVYVGSLAFAFDTAIPALGSAASIDTFKWALAALLILPQSVLLGTTFPLISSGVIRRFPDRSGETLAMLYFTNSLGAALGVLASGFWLIGEVGLPGTVLTAGILNVLLAVFVWVLARDEGVPSLTTPAPAKITSMLSRSILIAAFLAGMAAFIYEIAWIRMLSLVLGSSTHAFELMLSAFILGLAFGGYWVRKRIAGFSSPLRALAVMFALMGILGVATLPAYGFMFDVMSATINAFTPTSIGYVGFNLISHIIAAVMMIPTTLIAGMTLPLMTYYLMNEGAGEQAIGKVYAANTIGAIAGVLVAIHLMLPFIGTKGAVVAAAAFQLVIAFLLLQREQSAQRTGFSLGAIAASAVVILSVAAFVKLDPNRMASGVFRHGRSSLPPGAEVFYLRDGKTATITLTRLGDAVAIATNGKIDATLTMSDKSSAPLDEITMILAGALPLAIHPDPRRVANIGIGSGLTSQLVLLNPNVGLLDSVEIEPAIAEAARIGFRPRVEKLFTDPRSHIHFEDAKTFFATQKAPYDIIISEPSNPWVSGVASLFSGEFYSQVTRYLAKDGLLVQWVQIYETDVSVVASIVKAMSPHFHDYQIFNTDDADILIIASVNGAIPPIRTSVLDGGTAAELRRVGIELPAQFGLHRIGSKKTLDPLFASFPAPANSDYFPFVDLTAPKMRFLKKTAQSLSDLNLQQIPLMELLGEPGVPANAIRTDRVQFLARENAVQGALAIREALTTGDLTHVSVALGKDLVAITAPKTLCAQPGVVRAWLDSVQWIATKTTPYLAAEDLTPVWQAVRSSACFAEAKGNDRTLLDYLESLARRDRQAIVAHGSALLDAPDALSEDVRPDVVVAVAAALLGSADPKPGIELLKREIDMVNRQREVNLPMRLVEAIALARMSAVPNPKPGAHN